MRDEYVKSQNEMVFSCMEASKQSYVGVMQMPVAKLTAYLKWKTRLEEQKAKMLEDVNET